MTNDIMAAPPADAQPIDLADWLELTAFFDCDGQARLDQIDDCMRIQEEEQEDDIADADAARERLRDAIETEIDFRSNGLRDAYPFALSGDGENLALKQRGDRRGLSFYILCLVLSHATRSPILLKTPADANLRDVRKRHFQILSTLAVAGHTNGPAISLGWPRVSGEAILEVVARACAGACTGIAREVPANTANPSAKDGGIDVLAWKPANDRPPPTVFMFGQAASGWKWAEKTSKDEVGDFLEHYFEETPRCDYNYVTICPFRLDHSKLMRWSRRHGTILDRTRAPLYALMGVGLAEAGQSVDEAENACQLGIWLGRYRREARS